MKRSISLLLLLALLIGGFAYAGYRLGGDKENIALDMTILVSDTFGDKSFNDSAHDGGEALKEENVNVTYIECKGENFKQQMMSAAPTSDMVVCVGWEFWEIAEVSQEFPDTKFIWMDNSVESPEAYTNLMNVTFAQNEGSYLAGYIAAAMSNSGVIGAVGGNNDDTTNDFIVGYTQGAKQANSSVSVVTAYADGDYDNPELGETLAMSLRAQGADVIFQIAGDTGLGVIKAAKENEFYAIGVDKDQKIELPQYEDAILCSMKKDIGKAIYNIVLEYIEEGTFAGGTVMKAGMANGYVDICYGDKDSTPLVGDYLKAQVEDFKTRIENGDVVVDTTM